MDISTNILTNNYSITTFCKTNLEIMQNRSKNMEYGSTTTGVAVNYTTLQNKLSLLSLDIINLLGIIILSLLGLVLVG
ncbi:MAG: hypothetical protein L3J41_08730 [Melioribacteraceae bacterium]|nr:hypothetical protein [Melioribacteraceae bacterium]